MLRELSFGQLLEWQAFDKLEPVGALRGDWQAASVCSAVANSLAMLSHSRKRFRTQDFLLEWRDEELPVPEPVDTRPHQQTWQEQKMIAMMFAAASNAPTKKKWKR
jgi:hypothetical protein